MKAMLIALTLISVSTQNCSKKKEAADIPVSIQQKIAEIKAQPKWNPPAKVEEYNYNGKRVFVFSANCCDQFHQAFDENCNYICAPSGGITGKGDRKCEDFREKAQLVKVVWKDER